ncbi:hypothetical protein Sme01_12200 [Sphaerisporangium melleum]|uniref:Uncharacterized protein n=1 Tax=Sphaerisporangium melleum TaxID=321316 RepID=A0A917RHS8_9ACTN|nr:hypothetical protein [Sphaerisporangium melleum]GGL09131.1 hypothetical protein GCM10007964_59220 [Sphaerisporangium melleum]GII68744.1 hypothetical protein Sme01_12200 [Sphaerisporangium melleum]
MTRSEFDDIRAHIAAERGASDELLQIAGTLLDDLEQARLREATLRAHYLGLLTAARASIAADAVGDPDPLTFLRHELGKKGQLPTGEEDIVRILSDVRSTEALIAHLEQRPAARPRSASRMRRCSGTARRLPH